MMIIILNDVIKGVKDEKFLVNFFSLNLEFKIKRIVFKFKENCFWCGFVDNIFFYGGGF